MKMISCVLMGHRLRNVAVLVNDMGQGGAEKAMVHLAGALVRHGYPVDVLFSYSSRGPCSDPAAVDYVDLRTGRSWWQLARLMVTRPEGLTILLWDLLVTQQLLTRPHRSLPAVLRKMMRFLALVRYMKRSQPVVVYSAGDNAHMMALWARRVAGTETRVVATHHIVESAVCAQRAERVGRHRARLALCLLRRTLLQADANVSVSNGVGDDLARTGCIPREHIATIYNPIVPLELPALAEAPLDDPWFHPGAPPVILAVGRLVDLKDFPTLIRAFALLRRQRTARLVILGEGEERGRLEALAVALGVAEDTALPGFVSNPFAYMSRARVFVLSSKCEGMPMVLIEALACGCPVVSTNCVGPPEILADGKFGALVPVGDDAALAEASGAALEYPPPRQPLIERGMWFTVERAALQYEQFIPENRRTSATRSVP